MEVISLSFVSKYNSWIENEGWNLFIEEFI